MAQLSFEDVLIEEKHYSVSGLTLEIKQLLESSFREVWLEGEISNFNHHSSGHMYFSLKDENAQIGCVMWRSRNQDLFFTPQDGMKVVVLARLSVYEKRGNYQLDVLQMKPAGLGELQLAFEQLKNRLYDEGLFSDEYKREVPRYPERVGIVTSQTGAAVQDLVTVMRRRLPAIQIILKSVRVQGDGAATEIANAIREFNDFGGVDVLIVGRGGGSLEDLWAFNEESVARAVFDSRIPIVSAVGHEVDFTICDFVADLRAPTPSAAAELVVPSHREIATRVNQAFEDMTSVVLETLRLYREKIASVRKSYAFRRPQDLLMQFSQRCDELSRGLQRTFAFQLDRRGQQLDSLSRRLGLLEHRNVLKRGYALCFRRSDNKLVSKANDLQKKDEIEVNFYKGKILGTVTQVEA
ncbi:MAG: exodeoxyribonuclease VII large subunit [bacterium]